MFTCTRCGETKENDCFPKAKTCLSGYRSYCRLCKNKDTRENYHKNKERHFQKTKEWAINNPTKIKEIKASWKKRNPIHVATDGAKRSAIKRSATVLWDTELTDFVFEEAQDLRLIRNKLFGFSWHVDHVIPLQGKTVCGLHVWNNFAVIPAIINMRKSNKYAISEEWSSSV